MPPHRGCENTVTRKFDLNIERVLEHWTVIHALREIIANALDERALTATAEPEISKQGGQWHIRDWGRGLRYEHLTQNENKEKLAHPDQVVGKFGVGLKDALASFHRHRVRVIIRSRHGDITVGKERKHGFEDLTTLHALIDDPSDPAMVGTDVVLDGIKDGDVESAKGLFLYYSGDELIEHTPHGDVLRRGKRNARIYVNGLQVAEEPDFLFSYNITSPTKALRQALNRERSHVGRSAYTDRVKAILLACQSGAVADDLTEDLQQFQSGKMHDELQWIDVALHACRIVNASQKVIFLTPLELLDARSFVDRAREDGHRLIVIPDTMRAKLPNLLDLSGQPLRDLSRYRDEWQQSFEFTFVPVDDLTSTERAVWDRTGEIFALAGGKPRHVREVLVSETMRLQSHGYREAVGVWDAAEQRIVIKRTQLAKLDSYAGTLLHEVAHARSGADDVSEQFEDALTRLLGVVAARQLLQAPKKRS